jgi:raffinose/stachyose/melibiose transport system permease protein
MEQASGRGRDNRPRPTSLQAARPMLAWLKAPARASTRPAGRETHFGGRIGYLYLTPALLLYAVFFLWPFGHLVYLSLHHWDGITPLRWAGLQNYQTLLATPAFWLAFRQNMAWMLAAVVVPVVIGLGLAILVTRSPLRGKVLFRAVYFVPQVLSSVVVAVIWRWIYTPRFGALNRLLEALGLGAFRQGWLGEPNLALPALFIAWTWVHYGFTMVIFVAALEGIDEVYFDAAKVDGANAWQQLRHVLVPFIQAPLSTVMLISAIAAFQVFDLVFILTRGGPGQATMILSIFMYTEAFTYDKVGYGAAVAVVLGVIVLAGSVLFLWSRGILRDER